MPKLPDTKKSITTARQLARELETQTDYNLPDLEMVIFSLLLSGLNKAEVHEQVRLANTTDHISLQLPGSKKKHNDAFALFGLEEVTRIKVIKAACDAAEHRGWSEHESYVKNIKSLAKQGIVVAE